MLYKGEDLELLLPHGRGGSGRALTRLPAGPNWLTRAFEPADSQRQLWVDETVLQCCNQAYDLAVVHRAPEVGLEHLVHAMTLVANAIEVLRGYNVDVTTLRQESAAIIAGDRPLTIANGHAAPRNSEEFLAVLQLAADRAYSERSPISTEAILDTLFDMKSDQSRNLLSRHRADWRLRSQPEAPFDATRERSREAPTVTDDFQNTRLDELERAVHKLAGDISENKDAVAELLSELRGETADRPQPANGYSAPEAGPARNRGGGLEDVLDRLYAVQRNIDARFGELARGWDLLGQRIDELENAVGQQPRTEVEFDETVVQAIAAQVAGVLADKVDKIDRLETTLGGLPDRLITMERRLGQASASVDLAPLTQQLTNASNEIRTDLADLEKRLNMLAVGNGSDVAPLLSLMDKIEARVDDTGLLVQGHGERFDQLDRAVANQDVGGERIKALVDEAMGRVARTFEHQQDAIANAVAAAATSKLSLASDTINAREAEQSRMLASILEHVAKLEAGAGGVIDSGPLLTAINSVSREGETTRDAMIKLNTNQQTLANAFDLWREETRTEFAALRQDVAVAATPPGVAATDFGDLRKKIDDLQSSIAEHQDFWTRFRIWLYGTDDWYGASWDRGAR